MNNVANDLAVQSYCFRDFKTLDSLIEQVRKVGLSKIELCGVHADFSNQTGFDEVIKTFRDHGVTIVSIGVQGVQGNEAAERKFFDFVRRAGAKHMSVSFAAHSVPASYRVVEKLAEEFDVRVGIHNHGGRHWLGNTEMLSEVFAHTSKRIGLCLDTAWALDAGENPIAMAEKFIDRLYAVHFKDFTFDSARRPQDVIVGQGNLDLPRLVKLVNEQAPAGCCSILEYEGDATNPAPALRECVEAITKLK